MSSNNIKPNDYIIVGGGLGGCTLANLLSARSTNRLLLLEAVRDTPPGAEPLEAQALQPLFVLQ